MAKIFLTFFNGIKTENPKNIPCFYESFIKGLCDSGNEVFFVAHKTWNIPNCDCPEPILSKIKEFDPDIIIIFNNQFYDISDEFTCPILIYEVDSFLYYANKDAIYKSPNRYHYAVAQSSAVDILKENIPNLDMSHVLHIPFFSEVRASKVETINNICFIGSKFTVGDKSPWGDLMLTNPTDAEVSELKKIMRYVDKNPFSDKDKIIQDCQIKTDKILQRLNSSNYVNYLIKNIVDVNRISVIDCVADLGLTIYGTPSWQYGLHLNPDLALSYSSKNIFSLSDNEYVYNSHKIGINVNHIQATTGFSWRVCDVMASNACLVSCYSSDLVKLFPNIKIPMFENRFEARELCLKLLNNENMRGEIVAQCQEIIDKKYRFSNVLNALEGFLDINVFRKSDCIQKCVEVYYETLPYEKQQTNIFNNIDKSKPISKPLEKKVAKDLGFKNKIRYKIWKHLDKKLRKKGFIS